jgi:hypothetical protein
MVTHITHLADGQDRVRGSFIGLPSGLLISQPQGRPPILPSMSLPVKISTTPGMALAAARSMPLTSACACGLRTNTA